jgi:hypothetical protein
MHALHEYMGSLKQEKNGLQAQIEELKTPKVDLTDYWSGRRGRRR